MCCSVLQSPDVCCSVLSCGAVCCSVLQSPDVCCSVLQYVAVQVKISSSAADLFKSVLQCVAVS